jgi:hypothetical protein
VGSAVLPFLGNLPALGFTDPPPRKQRLIVIFSPNGVIPSAFWPDEEGEAFTLKRSLEPLEPFRSKTLFLHGVADKVRGDGDNHMRGIGCLLTGIELYPGNIQGGSDTPAGWASGLSIDQEIRNHLQSQPETRTRFGSLEFGVLVPERADTWTRMVYAGPNKPIAPLDDPYQVFAKLYGRLKDRESLQSVLDDVQEDLRRVESVVGTADRRLIEEHATFVREMEQELQASADQDLGHAVPEIEPGLKHENDQMPKISRVQIDLLVQSLVADFARVATLQFTNSVGGAKMRWIGVDQNHHELSHEPDSNEEAKEKLIKINRWFCEQLAYLARRLAETPEPGGDGTLLDNTLIVWTNELGKGNSHTLNDIPFVLVGGAPGMKMGRSLKFNQVAHNRLLLSFAHAMGHPIERFGNPDHCGDGPLVLA